MKKYIFISLTIFFILFFALAQCFKKGKYTALDIGDVIIDGSAYVESGEYYFNCNYGFFVKRIPPILPLDELRAGNFEYVSWGNKKLWPLLEKYIQEPGWEEGFEYTLTTRAFPSLFGGGPGTEYFDKYTTIEGVNYCISISKDKYKPFLTIDISKDSPDFSKGHRTHAEAIEEAKNSCKDPQ